MPAEQKKAASKKAESKSARPAASKKTHAEPKDYSKLFETVLEHIAIGETTSGACKKAKFPKSSFYRFMSSSEDEDERNALWDRYARARGACADVKFDEIADLEQQCLGGELDYNTFRAIVDSRKWCLARMKAKVYGDKSSHEVSGPGGSALNPPDLVINFTKGPSDD